MSREGFRHLLPALLLCACCLVAVPAQAQDVGSTGSRTVTLSQALELFGQNSLALRASQADAAAMIGLAQQAGAYPNPGIALTHEPSSQREENSSETYLMLSQRIRWPGLGEARTTAATQRSVAAHGRTAADSLRMAFDIVRTYIHAVSEEDRWLVLREVTETIRRGESSWETRYQEGEVSGYDVRRMRVERARYENLLADTILRRDVARRQLALLIFPEGGVAEVIPADRPVGAPW